MRDASASIQAFIRRELRWFLGGHHRDLQATQDVLVEIAAEKNTVRSVIAPVARDYAIPFTVGRGYSSLPPRHAIVQRFH